MSEEMDFESKIANLSTDDRKGEDKFDNSKRPPIGWFYSAERNYFMRGEDKEDYKPYDPTLYREAQQMHRELDQQQVATQTEQQTPSERLHAIDQQLITETDRDSMKELIKERLELSDQIEKEQTQNLEQDQSQGRDFEIK